MKLRLLFAFYLFFAINTSAQPKSSRSIIHTKKVYLHYQDRKDSLLIPVASAKYPQLQKALCDTALFGSNGLKGVINQYRENGLGTYALSYDIPFINKQVVSFQLYYEGMNAYPTTWTTFMTLDINTGKPYPLAAELTTEGLRYVFARYKQKLRGQLRSNNARIMSENDADLDTATKREIIQTLRESVDTLRTNTILTNFVFTKTGILLTTEEVLPHWSQGFDLDRDLVIPYSKLKPYIKNTSLIIKNATK